MASSDKKRKTKQKWAPSGGLRRHSLAMKGIVRTKIKIKRWKRYQDEILAGTRKVYTNKAGKERPTRWDTTKLESHLKNLQAIVKQGKTF